VRLQQNGERVIKWRPEYKFPILPPFLLNYPFSLSMKEILFVFISLVMVSKTWWNTQFIW